MRGISKPNGILLFPITFDEDAFSVNNHLHRFWYRLLIYELVLALLMLYEMKTPFPVNKLSKSLLVYVVDVSAVSAMADVISNDDAVPVNN